MYRRLTKPSCEKAKFASNDPLTENMIRSPCTETDKKTKVNTLGNLANVTSQVLCQLFALYIGFTDLQ